MDIDGAPTGIAAPHIGVIGAGFGRTGTTSLRRALELLGFDPCDHMHDNFAHPERFALWADALERKESGDPIDWRPLLADYRAVVDWPAAHFWRELVGAHPHARVVLTVRDPDRWFDSIQDTIFPFLDLLARMGGPSLPGDIITQRTFDRRTTDRAHCQAVYANHLDTVRNAIAPDRLLIFDVAQGWDPLCAFLGVPAPHGEPFPHLNDTAEFQDDVRRMSEDVAPA